MKCISFFTAILALMSHSEDQSLAKHIYPLSKAVACPPVEIDISDDAEAKEWSAAAKGLIESWFPKITELLATDGRDPVSGEMKGKAFAAPKTIRLVFKKDLNVPAYTSGSSITINGKWIAEHPDDLGMVVHELTHVIQGYGGRRAPGWLVEGIADYIRWWRYEPELHAGPGRTKVNPERAKYTDSYRTTAVWLAWCSRRYDMRLVPALDKAMRDGDDPIPLFEKLTGRGPEELFKEFLSQLK